MSRSLCSGLPWLLQFAGVVAVFALPYLFVTAAVAQESLQDVMQVRIEIYALTEPVVTVEDWPSLVQNTAGEWVVVFFENMDY